MSDDEILERIKNRMDTRLWECLEMYDPQTDIVYTSTIKAVEFYETKLYKDIYGD